MNARTGEVRSSVSWKRLLSGLKGDLWPGREAQLQGYMALFLGLADLAAVTGAAVAMAPSMHW